MALKLVKDIKQESSELILKGLNTEQKKGVTGLEGPYLILAGAGSGKTRVLTHRIAYLLDKGVPAYKILALTFTNKAAKEMRNRISSIVSTESASQIWAGTFHSIFARILRTEAEKIGYTSSFTIYDSDDSQSVIRKIAKSMLIDTKEYPPPRVHGLISWAKNKMTNWQKFMDNADTPYFKMVADVYKQYEEKLKENNAMDFDDLLVNMINLFSNNMDVLDKYQNKFKYLLVDEYQDTNRAQYTVLKMLAAKHNNICVVGDDSQSIYKWRGAEIKNIMDFEREYGGCQTIRLEQNYRSTKTILAAADSVIKRNSQRIPKTLWTDNQEGEKIRVLASRSDLDEAATIAEKIKKELENPDYTYNSFAVLYRTNAQSLLLEKALRERQMPYVIVGGMSFYKRKEVKDAFAYLRLLVNPKDDASLTRIINEPPRKIGAKSLSAISEFAASKNASLLETLDYANEIGGLLPRAASQAKLFFEMIKKYRENRDGLSPSQLAMDLIEETKLLEMYEGIGTDEAMDKFNNIQQVLADISTFFRENDKQGNNDTDTPTTLDEYLQQISLFSDIDNADLNEKIKLMTLHSAKGLEFPVVFIAGLERGLFPLSYDGNDNSEIEEERRLFYVGITRAEEKLYLSYSHSRLKFGNIETTKPSQFLYEIDKQYLQWDSENDMKRTAVHTNRMENGLNFSSSGSHANSKPRKVVPPAAAGTKQSGKPLTSPFKKSQELPKINFKTGDNVEHAHFGEGKVMGMSGIGANRKAVVNFKSVGLKHLMLQYANLKKI